MDASRKGMRPALPNPATSITAERLQPLTKLSIRMSAQFTATASTTVTPLRSDTPFEPADTGLQPTEENNIKHMTTKVIIPGAAAIMLLCSLHADAQTVVRERVVTEPAVVPAETTTTTTTVAPVEAVGTVTEFAPDAVVLRANANTDPVRYSMAKRIEYVDDVGAPVAREVIRAGVPVTVRYVREGDRRVVNRVVVHRTTAVAPDGVTTRKTTTTTTTTEK